MRGEVEEEGEGRSVWIFPGTHPLLKLRENIVRFSIGSLTGRILTQPARVG